VNMRIERKKTNVWLSEFIGFVQWASAEEVRYQPKQLEFDLICGKQSDVESNRTHNLLCESRERTQE
jgi:hypothetical protein